MSQLNVKDNIAVLPVNDKHRNEAGEHAPYCQHPNSCQSYPSAKPKEGCEKLGKLGKSLTIFKPSRLLRRHFADFGETEAAD